MIVAASFDTKNPELWVNRGLSYGDGLFETMRLNKQRIPLLSYHMSRLNQDLKRLQLNAFDWAVIDQILADQEFVQHAGVLKLMVFRANQARTYTPLTEAIEWVLTADELPLVVGAQPLRLALAEQNVARQPLLAGIKHLSRLEQVLLCAELNQHHDVDDVLLTDNSNQVIETGYQNIVMIKNNQLLTPNLNQCGVKGVALQWLQANQDVLIRQVSIEALSDCDALMVCNSIRGFRLVESVKMLGKECISFSTSHHIHDKISSHWDALFNS